MALNCTSPVHGNVDVWSCPLASVLCNTREHSLKDQQPCLPAWPVSVCSHVAAVMLFICGLHSSELLPGALLLVPGLCLLLKWLSVPRLSSWGLFLGLFPFPTGMLSFRACTSAASLPTVTTAIHLEDTPFYYVRRESIFIFPHGWPDVPEPLRESSSLILGASFISHCSSTVAGTYF